MPTAAIEAGRPAFAGIATGGAASRAGILAFSAYLYHRAAAPAA